MFAGGSAVCCVDEVSTGLDPISRRRIWEILLAERQRRTIIMTTHFLDEADYLADNIAIMYKGSLRAEGTSATLKNRFGNGYTIKLPNHMDLDIPLSGPVEKEASRHQMVYRVGNAALAAELIEYLEAKDIHDYQISGPTMEELFLKATGDTIASAESTSSSKPEEEDKSGTAVVVNVNDTYELVDGRPISVFKQWYILLGKRFRILRRRWIPYFVAVAFALVGAGIAPLLIKSFSKPMKCPVQQDLIYDYTYRSDFASNYQPRYLFGPPDKLNNARIAQMANVYSLNHTAYPDMYGYHNGTELRDQLVLVNSFEELIQKVEDTQHNFYDNYGSYYDRRVDGGLWMTDDSPTVVANVQQANAVSEMLNFFDNLLSGVPISSSYQEFAQTQIPEVFDYKPLLFMIYYGLILAV